MYARHHFAVRISSNSTLSTRYNVGFFTLLISRKTSALNATKLRRINGNILLHTTLARIFHLKSCLSYCNRTTSCSLRLMSNSCLLAEYVAYKHSALSVHVQLQDPFARSFFSTWMRNQLLLILQLNKTKHIIVLHLY